jgi:hypothetical protein
MPALTGVWHELEAYGKVSRPWPGLLQYFQDDYTFHPDMAKVTAHWPLASLFAQGGAVIWQGEWGSTEVIVYSFTAPSLNEVLCLCLVVPAVAEIVPLLL